MAKETEISVQVGRPRTGKPIHVRLPEDQVAELDRLAQAKGISRAEMLRELVDAVLSEDRPARIKAALETGS
jgi:metal-responsive CopG/Arc/MetJ family transcriptional regulator